ncbi:hypothetical protein ABQF34_23565 [Mycolicibacterium boenickei]
MKHVEAANAVGKNTNRSSGLARATAAVGVCLGMICTGMGLVPNAFGDETPYHIRSAQDLCNSIWPTSQAMPRPDEFGTVCARKGGVLERLSKSMPAFISDTFKLEPGSAVELPVGSVRVNPDDPMSDWIIPDCHVSGGPECGT